MSNNWLPDGTPINRPDLAQRRLIAAHVFTQRTGTPNPPGWEVCPTPSRCSICWDGHTYGVVQHLDAYGNRQILCTRHMHMDSYTASTCACCGNVFIAASNVIPHWVRSGLVQTDIPVGEFSLCRVCTRDYAPCTECERRYHMTRQTQCCVQRARCSFCNGRETDDAPFAHDVEIASRYSFTETETLAHVCGDCETDSLRTCIDCGRLVRRNDTYAVGGMDGMSVCTADVNGYNPGSQFQWEVCGRHGIAFRSGVDEIDCCNPYSQIHSYSYKPNPVFRGDGQMFYGAEIEVCANDHDAAADAAGRGFKGIVYLKEDGSIRDGFEMVTHPMSFGYWMNDFPWETFDALKAAGAYAHSSCGIHVHAARKGFSGPAHEHRWMAFFDRNQANIEKIARRANNSYARFGQISARDKKRIARYKEGRPGHFQRYSAINVNNAHTYEVRIFATSVDADQVKAAIAFVSATVEYTRELKARDVLKGGGMGWDAFRSWVESRSEYAPLFAEINRVGA